MYPDRPVVTRSGGEDEKTAQSGGLKMVSGVGPHSGAERFWFGKAQNEPGFRSLPHHHGEAETGAYLLSGAPASTSERISRSMSRWATETSCLCHPSCPTSKPT